MGVTEELAMYEELVVPTEVPVEPRAVHRWAQICVCGHEDQMHGAANGGRYGQQTGGRTTNGCRGASPNRGEVPLGRVGKALDMPPTCPCMKVRPVAEIDRPWRYFRQKTWTKDTIHPLRRGLKAMRTGLAKRASVPDPDAELDRRFRWIDGARKCSVCGKADGAWPMYVDGSRASEMRCAAHLPDQIGSRL